MVNVNDLYTIELDNGQPYIAHHGILGMKWGVRRYQNSDGTLTPEGRKRYGIVERAKDKYSDMSMRGRIKEKQLEMIAVSNDTHSHEKALQLTKPHYAKLVKQIADEYEKSKEYKSYLDSETRLNAYRQEMNKKYKSSDITSFDVNDSRKAQELANKRNEMATKASKKRLDIWAKHHDDILSTKVKDLGYEDTISNRERFDRLVYDAAYLNVNDYDMVR